MSRPWWVWVMRSLCYPPRPCLRLFWIEEETNWTLRFVCICMCLDTVYFYWRRSSQGKGGEPERTRNVPSTWTATIFPQQRIRIQTLNADKLYCKSVTYYCNYWYDPELGLSTVSWEIATQIDGIKPMPWNPCHHPTTQPTLASHFSPVEWIEPPWYVRWWEW